MIHSSPLQYYSFPRYNYGWDHSLFIASVDSGHGFGGQVKDETGIEHECDVMDEGT